MHRGSRLGRGILKSAYGVGILMKSAPGLWAGSRVILESAPGSAGRGPRPESAPGLWARFCFFGKCIRGRDCKGVLGPLDPGALSESAYGVGILSKSAPGVQGTM